MNLLAAVLLAPATAISSGSEPRTPPDAPSEVERGRVVADIVAAVDDGVLDADEGGRRLSLAYRATDPGRLRALARAVATERSDTESSESRRARWWALARIAAYAIASAMMVYAVLHGVSPTDPH